MVAMSDDPYEDETISRIMKDHVMVPGRVMGSLEDIRAALVEAYRAGSQRRTGDAELLGRVFGNP